MRHTLEVQEAKAELRTARLKKSKGNATTQVRDCGGPAIAVGSMRDYFAGQAIIGYAANARVMDKAIDEWDDGRGPRPSCIANFLAGLAYEVADEMLAARERKT